MEKLSKVISVRMNIELKNQLQKMADERKRTLSNFINHCLLQALDNINDVEPDEQSASEEKVIKKFNIPVRNESKPYEFSKPIRV